MTDRAFDIIDVRAGLEEENEKFASEVRALCREKGIYLVNLMASPGAGKTTLLCRVLEKLRDSFDIGVLEADVDADVDAQTIAQYGAHVVQLHTGGSCHMDGRMTMEGLRAFGENPPKLIFLENVGNLVCPAEFDVGADLKLMILSVPEGDDKPLKYPLMFTVAECVLVNKIDTRPVFDFDAARFEKNLRALNEVAPVFFVSAKTGEGMENFAIWLKGRIS